MSVLMCLCVLFYRKYLVKIRFSESKAEVEVEESINHNARFRAWQLVGSSVSASNIDNYGIVLILTTPIPLSL